MVVKINSKPIKIEEEPKQEHTFNPVYLAVSTIGFALILWIMDYVCYTFFYIHPIPWIVWVGKVISFF